MLVCRKNWYQCKVWYVSSIDLTDDGCGFPAGCKCNLICFTGCLQSWCWSQEHSPVPGFIIFLLPWSLTCLLQLGEPSMWHSMKYCWSGPLCPVSCLWCIWARPSRFLCPWVAFVAPCTFLQVDWSLYWFWQYIANLAGNKKLILPVPAFNVINGGSHAGNKLAMQVGDLLVFLLICLSEKCKDTVCPIECIIFVCSSET